jgi:membrane protein
VTSISLFWQGSIRVLQILWQRFDRHQGLLRASALSFDTTLGLIPLLALVLVGLKLAGIQQVLGPLVLQQLAGNSQETGARILAYVDNAQVGSLGVFGLFVLLVSLFFLLENVRDAFNVIWDVQEQRGLLRRCADYLGLLVFSPLLLILAFGMTSLLQSQKLLQWLINHTPLGDGVLLLFRLTPFLCISLVLMLAYLVLPATRIRFQSAFTGAFLVGAIWQMAHFLYFRFQFGIARYNAMYGALALLPFLLIWIYISWLLVLLGLELVRCHQQGSLTFDQKSCSQER